ncbi:hypothetical protein Patl1_07818 [Pistacia atlantica]|uniref:Uncharacterized protein n=1 Tax=Pistacia atlantica TaxID=434234 RepID=A0ACC1ACZ4_9ROSI|nr:hypothetical protein Patl1_07818 [Pistacia atlantica]
MKSSANDDRLTFEQLSCTYLFWAKAWTLVGDVYVEFHRIKGTEISIQAESKTSTRELRMSSEVVKEVQRLKRKLGQYNQNCSSCSLVNCSCQSDRASSGSSASSSSGDKRMRFGKSSDNRNFQLNKGGDALVGAEESLETCNVEFTVPARAEIALREAPKAKNGGIFKYLEGPIAGDVEHNLSAALSCYEEARKALGGLPTVSEELQSVLKKKGWVWNELGRIRLERKELDKAEHAFAESINVFRDVSDHTNIILINCNLAHGRRALAEEMVSKVEGYKIHTIFRNAYKQSLETAKLEYSESLRYYGAAKSHLNTIVEDASSVSDSLRNEVYTQFAHTYLRLGMLLAREDTTAEVYENRALKQPSVPSDRRSRKELRKHEISANDAIRVALSVYESMGDLRKQEAAYAYFQLACYQRDCCLKFLESDHEKNNLPKGENSIGQRVKQYASLAERNWQKAMDFYGPTTHSTICWNHHYLAYLKGRHISETFSKSLSTDYPEIYTKFWNQMQMLLRKMLAMSLPASSNKSSPTTQPNPSTRSGDAGKLRELYKMSLKSTDVHGLHAMYSLWTS